LGFSGTSETPSWGNDTYSESDKDDVVTEEEVMEYFTTDEYKPEVLSDTFWTFLERLKLSGD
jgi:hypothetical protein